ncbi:MAG: hypothetical protein COB67_12840 [SAR324 cluster bacterium]|uniref:Uncharacterized protein n=1 Tax=SAR324 cluster bacterium TaxID=2024889 RepID=A0A2A4SRJ2_9DELT|nr:MAG: hypothetical protein COB67_12840 [SAR324 cluster bacterium]
MCRIGWSKSNLNKSLASFKESRGRPLVFYTFTICCHKVFYDFLGNNFQKFKKYEIIHKNSLHKQMKY